MKVRLSALLLALCLLTSCSSKNSTSPAGNLPPATDSINLLIKGLSEGDISKAPFWHASADAQKDYLEIMHRMHKIWPQITVGKINYSKDPDQAKVELKYEFPIGKNNWKYSSSVILKFIANKWVIDWQPTIIHPELSPTTKLEHHLKPAKRGSIIGANGQALVELRTVYHVGLDKTKIPQNQWATTAKKMSLGLNLNPNDFPSAVIKAGPKAFVTAITLRKPEVPANVSSLPGFYIEEGKNMLAPYRGFAASILGTTGQPTAEEIKNSKNRLSPDSIVGKSGLQKFFNKKLSGEPEELILLTSRNKAEHSASTDKKPSSSSTTEIVSKTLFEEKGKPGENLEISLNYDAQVKAEEVLKKQPGIASFVVINPSTGGILAIANSPAANGYDYASNGQYAPGSTFKVVTSLALLRKGYNANSTISCPTSLNVNGHVFTNAPGYPDSKTGNIILKDALTYSCNTAFVGATKILSANDLVEAAKSLGLGEKYNPGFSVFYGAIPDKDSDSVGKAASMIGQGQLEISATALAAVPASVAAKKTVIPWLVKDKKPQLNAKPLTVNEATQLQIMMSSVASNGTAKGLNGKMTGAKTGTAEFIEKGAIKKHAWLMAWKPNLAIVSMVYDGKSGAKDNVPIILDYLK